MKMKILEQLSAEIQNSNVSAQQKEILIGFLNKTSQLIPLLTNEDLIENDTKEKIIEITGKN
jgi:taurine transport system permease protein